MKGSRSSRRVAAYAAIDSERDYQAERWGGTLSSNREPGVEEEGGKRTLDEFCLYIARYGNRVLELGGTSDNRQRKLDAIRKVAALAVAAMEEHGAPHREGFESFEECEEIDLALMGTFQR